MECSERKLFSTVLFMYDIPIQFKFVLNYLDWLALKRLDGKLSRSVLPEYQIHLKFNFVLNYLDWLASKWSEGKLSCSGLLEYQIQIQFCIELFGLAGLEVLGGQAV